VSANPSFRGRDPDGSPQDGSSAAVRLAVRAALQPLQLADGTRDGLSRAHLTALYAAVAARVAILRDDGLRPERALLALKTETNAVIDDLAFVGVHVDGIRASEVLNLVVRWSV